MQESTQSLWFGRDVFGRRSLLWHTPSEDDPVFALCSIGQYHETDMPLVSKYYIHWLYVLHVVFRGTGKRCLLMEYISLNYMALIYTEVRSS